MRSATGRPGLNLLTIRGGFLRSNVEVKVAYRLPHIVLPLGRNFHFVATSFREGWGYYATEGSDRVDGRSYRLRRRPGDHRDRGAAGAGCPLSRIQTGRRFMALAG